ncbi:hypothetical protein LMH87_007158 [Akanthomyces muscarius]|uniref:WW domain-containing protein n=1 Tax=Akanthomyces muscarius TaxID=2231603 RepID=A0A9W8QP52_AKAMU|nr:hypothetical protein LMH87_007158 [Akanthomyces muscarius]KAJ4165528.1 hypothetical protein LMH87_007158 [Akanthomyces muscarius]
MASLAPEVQASDVERAAPERSQEEVAADEGASVATPPADDDDAADNAETDPPAGDKNATGDATDQADLEDGEVGAAADSAPPLPSEPTPDGPPLPSEPVPSDDGWDCQFDAATQAWFFYNRFTGKTQWDNPRVPTTTAAAAAAAATSSAPPPQLPPAPPAHEQPPAAVAGGYNPAIHGDYDPDAWYAKGTQQDTDEAAATEAQAAADMYAASVAFNRFSGGFQAEDAGPGRHTDEAKARRQMNAYFDADAASAAHDGRSLRAERQSKKPSKAEVKAFKEKRRARKEEKRRAWLRD